MDAVDFFLTRYSEVHTGLVDGLFGSLSDTQLRSRPHPGVNTIAWLLWHSARIEDVALNRFLTDRVQVLTEWIERLAVPRRDVGTGMTDAQVDDLSARIDLQALRGYLGAVTGRTLAVVETLRASDLESPVPADRVRSVVQLENVVAPGAEWLTDFWARGRSRAWTLAQTALLHPYGHYYEARVAAGLLGSRSP
jgi:DinB family protein